MTASSTSSSVFVQGGLTQIVDGLEFGEGPVWLADKRLLLFSDIADDKIWQWRASEGASVFRTPANMPNGLCLDLNGDLIICEHATTRLTRLKSDGEIEVIASHWDGKELNSPNDVVGSSDGSLWFSDPTGGRQEHVGIPRDQELDFVGFFRVAPDGELQLMADDFQVSNGLCFSPDEKYLYVNDTTKENIRRFRHEDGKLSDDTVWCEMPGSGFPEPGCPDGMKTLSDGRIVATGPNGVWVIDPSGEHLETLETPDMATNMAFGGDDWKTLFITTLKGVYMIPLTIPGMPAIAGTQP